MEHSALRSLIKKRLRKKPNNDKCAITFTDLSECKKVFVKITENRYKRGYDAKCLYSYFENKLDSDQIDDLKWPVSREEVTSTELKRLEKMLKIQKSRCVSHRKNIFWKLIFQDTLLVSLDELLVKITQDISVSSPENDVDESEIAETVSSLVASLLYLYIMNKFKWRSFKNSKLRSSDPRVNQIFTHIKVLSEEMNSMFLQHDLNLAWRGNSIVPLIRKIEIPARLR